MILLEQGRHANWVKAGALVEDIQWKYCKSLMGHPLEANLTLLFPSFTSFNKGSFSYISDKKPVSISIKETDYFLKIFRSREVARIGHLLALSIPGVGHLQILRCPGAGHLPTPNFWHARGFLSEYNFTEDFTGKTSSSVKDRKKLKRYIKGMFSILCMHFFIAYQARIT